MPRSNHPTTRRRELDSPAHPGISPIAITGVPEPLRGLQTQDTGDAKWVHTILTYEIV